MTQQINLFNPIFLKQKQHFSALSMAQGLGGIMLGSMLLSILVVASPKYLFSVDKEAEVVTAQLTSTQDLLSKVTVEYGTRQKSKALENQLEKAEIDVKSMQQVFDTLQKGEFNNTKGYSEYLRAFSHQIVEGLWLTGFSICGDGSEMGLKGRALQPQLVPAYITRLKQEPIMQKKSFGVLQMQVPSVAAQSGATNKNVSQTDKESAPVGYIEFNLQSSLVAKEENANSSEAKTIGSKYMQLIRKDKPAESVELSGKCQ